MKTSVRIDHPWFEIQSHEKSRIEARVLSYICECVCGRYLYPPLKQEYEEEIIYGVLRDKGASFTLVMKTHQRQIRDEAIRTCCS